MKNRRLFLWPPAQRRGAGTPLAILLVIGHLLLAAAGAAAQQGLLEAPPANVKTFQVWEMKLGARRPGSQPYVNGPSVTATFTAPTGRRFRAAGFWDGGNVWRVRFAPTLPGIWSCRTSSRDAGLNNIGGTFTADAPTEEELAANPLRRGFLQRSGDAWTLSDGSIFLPRGDSQFSFSEEFTLDEVRAWIDVLHHFGLNTLHGCAWLALYNRGGMRAFHGAPAAGNLNERYFQRLDRMVAYANEKGIMVGLVIGGFPGNSHWWSRLFPQQAEDDRWFKYIVARYAAYNVRWVLYGEADEDTPPWAKKWQDEIVRKASLVRRQDPYDHPIGSHQTRDLVDARVAGNGNITYIEAQNDPPKRRTETQYKKALEWRRYRKPLWFEEYWYESAAIDNEVSLGIRNTHRNFVAALAFPTMGSRMRAHQGDADFPPTAAAEREISMAQYLREDPGLMRMAHFGRFYEGLNLLDFQPGISVSRGVASRFGSDYAIFVPGERNNTRVRLNLRPQGPRTWRVSILEIDRDDWMLRESTVTANGAFEIDTGVARDVAILVRRIN